MRGLVLKPGVPFSLTLAADARLASTDYTDDQIWNLSINRGEPPGLLLETTYGLRARSQRIFPRFTEGDYSITDPGEFLSPVTIAAYYPNYVELSFTPLKSLQASLAYWIASSQVVIGRVVLQNLTEKSRLIRIEWVSLLVPTSQGQRMVAGEISNVSVLSGQTDQLHPVLFVPGGARHSNGPYPALSIEVEIEAGAQASFVCALASQDDLQASFDLARSTASRKWEAELARILMTNTRQIQVITGDPAWDHVFDLTQVIATSLIMSPSEYLPCTSFVLARQPDRGYSLRGDGSDYSPMWNGQTALNALFLSQELLPQYPEFGRNFLENFLAIQSEDGMIDWRPGLGNQRSALASTPILASLAWSIFERNQDEDFLQKVYPKLIHFLDFWFRPEYDHDQDGIPEWNHLFQTGFEDHPLFSYWMSGTDGIRISTVESPDLCSMLFMECQSLLRMEKILQHGDSERHKILVERAERLKNALESTWDVDRYCYQYWDRDAHISPASQTIITHTGAGDWLVQQTYPQPVRLQIILYRPSEATRRINIFVHGNNPSGDRRVERIMPDQFQWNLENGYTTSERIYSYIEKVVIEGLQEDDRITVQTVGLNLLDQTVLLPLWARIPSLDQAKQLVENCLMNPKLFYHPNGIICHPDIRKIPKGDIHVVYNTLLLRGMMRYDLRVEAMEVFTRLMNTLVANYQREGCFRRVYTQENGLGIGEENSLEGLVPIGIFLEILGIQIITPWKIQVQGFNPFPWPITVKYGGTTILRQQSKTNIVFSDGQTVTLDDAAPHLISME